MPKTLIDLTSPATLGETIMCELCEPGGANRSCSWPLNDGYGIYLTRVCEACEAEALASYRPDITDRYDTDEQIEPD